MPFGDPSGVLWGVLEVPILLAAALAPVVVPVLLWRVRRKAIAAFLISYVALYCVLSSQGRYIEYIGGTADGSCDWYPLWCDNTKPSPWSGRIKSGPSTLGVFFWPLLAVDQAAVHRACWIRELESDVT